MKSIDYENGYFVSAYRAQDNNSHQGTVLILNIKCIHYKNLRLP